MSTIKNDSNSAQDSMTLGRRKLLQALAATSGAAVLGGLKVDLNWEAPFVEISQIQAQATSNNNGGGDGGSSTPKYYDLKNFQKAVEDREAAFKVADPAQGAKRSVIDVSTSGKDSPFVTSIQPPAATINGESSNIKRIGTGGSTNNGQLVVGVALLQCYIVGNSGEFTLEISELGDASFSGAHNAIISNDKSGKKLIKLEKMVHGGTVVLSMNVPSGETYELELMIGKGSEFGGADNLANGSQGIFAVIGMVKISK